MSDFKKAIEKIKKEKTFLMVGRRLNLEIREEINFQNLNWKEKLKERLKKESELFPENWIDYFVFQKNLFDKIPLFVIRTVWDNWLIWYAWKRKAKIIDATKVITAIHQKHLYLTKEGQEFNPWKSKEAKINLKLAGGYKHCLNINDATHILTEKGLRKAPKMSVIRRIDLLPFIGIFTRQRFKFKKLFKKNEN